MFMYTSLDLPQLRTFYTLAQTGSFTACARRLHRTQSAVSHAMAKLESMTGMLLQDGGIGRIPARDH